MSKPTFLIFDTETHGLPKDYKLGPEHSDNWPRVLQIAWEVYDENFQLIERVCELIKPEGWTITDAFSLKNGFTTENNDLKGVPMKEMLQRFIARRTECAYSVAHNISFDAKILRAEMIRHNMVTEFTATKICTMNKSTKYCGLFSDKSSRFKWPKLEELHLKLFGYCFEGAHDGAADVAATAKCFFELLKRGIITL